VALVWSCASGSTGSETQGQGAGSGCDPKIWYRDADGDGFGNDQATQTSCDQPPGYIDVGGDCDDGLSVVFPGADEDCTVMEDYNCDGSVGYADLDGDGVPACEDCNDQNPDAYPGADEICDGVDNDCDMLVDLDDEPDDELCPVIANAVATCDPVQFCSYSCAGDYFDVNNDDSDGCECLGAPSPATAGESCPNAIDLGTLTDGNLDLLTLDGNSPEAARDTWLLFTAADDADTSGDEFHVDVRFSDNPGGAFAMSVYRNGCPGTGEELAVDELDSFDWYTDFPFTSVGCTGIAPCGQGNCSSVPSTTTNLCTDNTATFYVKIRRLDGAASCELYTLELSNGVY
jgi:hypothetical protein